MNLSPIVASRPCAPAASAEKVRAESQARGKAPFFKPANLGRQPKQPTRERLMGPGGLTIRQRHNDNISLRHSPVTIAKQPALPGTVSRLSVIPTTAEAAESARRALLQKVKVQHGEQHRAGRHTASGLQPQKGLAQRRTRYTLGGVYLDLHITCVDHKPDPRDRLARTQAPALLCAATGAHVRQ